MASADRSLLAGLVGEKRFCAARAGNNEPRNFVPNNVTLLKAHVGSLFLPRDLDCCAGDFDAVIKSIPYCSSVSDLPPPPELRHRYAVCTIGCGVKPRPRIRTQMSVARMLTTHPECLSKYPYADRAWRRARGGRVTR